MTNDHRLTLDDVYDLSLRALTASGARSHQADPGARSVRDAEADGIRNVGLGYLPIYCEHLKCGKLIGDALPSVTQVAPASIVADAANGFAHTAYEMAEPKLITAARTSGIAGLSITNSYSAGVVAWFVERLAAQDLVALAFANSPALMPAAGGRSRFFGTNPLAYGVPRAEGAPLVVDQATSQVAFVRIKDAAKAGEKIPLGWGLDRQGQPTEDPQAVISGGAMAPMGGYKGALMALMVDVMGGGLGGPSFSHQASAFGNNEGDPPAVGQMFIAIEPKIFAPAERLGASYEERIETLLAAMTGDEGARIPGGNRIEHRKKAAEHGVTVPADLYDKLQAYAAGAES